MQLQLQLGNDTVFNQNGCFDIFMTVHTKSKNS